MRVENLDQKIAQKLIKFRQSLGLSQRQFAQRADIDQAHLNKIEKCKMSVSFTNLQKISKTYKVPIKHFFEFDEATGNNPQLEKISALVGSISENWKLRLLEGFLRELRDTTP